MTFRMIDIDHLWNVLGVLAALYWMVGLSLSPFVARRLNTKVSSRNIFLLAVSHCFSTIVTVVFTPVTIVFLGGSPDIAIIMTMIFCVAGLAPAACELLALRKLLQITPNRQNYVILTMWNISASIGCILIGALYVALGLLMSALA